MEILSDKYELVQCIGRGGFGSVWLARDKLLGREVAIKRLNVSDSSSSTSSQRLEREAIATAKLDHPNVVKVFDVGALPESDEIYLVMERLEGRTLLEELAEVGPIEASRAKRLIAGALRGLHAAHQAGVVHKDLKPANLFIERPGESGEKMKVIDFGIARLDSLDKLTKTGRMAGSPRYLAPEYIRDAKVTPRIDIYQTGLIIAEMITGRPCVPRGLDFVKACLRHVEAKLEFEDDFLATPLGKLVLRATDRDPEKRFRTAAEFATALEEAEAPTKRYTLTQKKITEQWTKVAAESAADRAESESDDRSDFSAALSREGWMIVIAALSAFLVVAGVALAAVLVSRFMQAGTEPTSTSVASVVTEPAGKEAPATNAMAINAREAVAAATYELETAVMVGAFQAKVVGEQIVSERGGSEQLDEPERGQAKDNSTTSKPKKLSKWKKGIVPTSFEPKPESKQPKPKVDPDPDDGPRPLKWK